MRLGPLGPLELDGAASGNSGGDGSSSRGLVADNVAGSDILDGAIASGGESPGDALRLGVHVRVLEGVVGLESGKMLGSL